MFQSFTGSSRKPRQVNLSGQTANNHKNPSSIPRSSVATPGSQAAVAQAQAQRVQRERERERLNASRVLQRTWRGHTGQRKIRQTWREEWDQHEMVRTGSPGTGIPLVVTSTEKAYREAEPYGSAKECYSQMRLLLHFLNIHEAMDRARLAYFGGALRTTLEALPSISTGDAWTMQLYRLSKLAVEVIEMSRSELRNKDFRHFESLLALLLFLTRLIPKYMARNATRYYSMLSRYLSDDQTLPRNINNQFLEAVLALLTPITAETMTAYTAFGIQLLAVPETLTHVDSIRLIAPRLNFRMLTTAVRHALETDRKARAHVLDDSRRSLWLLAHFIHLYTGSFGSDTGWQISHEKDYTRMLVMLLSARATDITHGIEILDEPTDNKHQRVWSNASPASTPLPPYVREQILTLAQKDCILGMMSQINLSGSEQDASSESAQVLATYALTLTRVFPKRATEIRMWLYEGSANIKASTGTPAIIYFWHYSRATMVFQKISKDHHNAVSLLKAFLGLGQSMSPKVAEGIQQEWRTLLLFLELYSFAITYMDDEEFLAGGRFGAGGSTRWGAKIRESSLPLEDVRLLVIFLKNLAFALYWNSRDLQQQEDVLENPSSLGTYFGTSSTPVKGVSNSSEHISQESAKIQLRDLVTGLLRSIHQRDSRRNFFATGFWLMSSQVDMSGFIPAVAAEEERRHEVQDLDEDDEDEYTDANGEEAQMFGELTGLYSHNFPGNARQSQMMQEQKRVRYQRHMAAVAPRLEILRNLPFFIPFETRVQIFREFILRDQKQRRGENVDPDAWRWSISLSSTFNPVTGRPTSIDILQRHHADIQRQHIFSSAFDQFYKLGDGLKEPIQITFIDQFGAKEVGIDGGGVTKEFLTSITKETFDPLNEEQLFVANDQNLLYPNPGKLDSHVYPLRTAGMQDKSPEMKTAAEGLLARYKFLGRIIGKCLYEGFLIDVSFAGYFLLRWALTGGTTQAAKESGYHATMDDLRDLDEDLYQGLLKLKHYDGDVESDFGLNFAVVDTFEVPAPIASDAGRMETKSITRPLKPSGADIPVTNSNRPEYIFLLASHRLRTQSWYQTNAFLSGLREIVQPMWLSMFNQSELQRLVGGDSREIDVSDLRANTIYSGLYDMGDDEEDHPTIKIFWDVLRQMDDQDRRKVLKFVTSTPRAPLLGFSHLNPRFSIRDSGRASEGRLPSTSTCVNLLKLPRYDSARVLKEKLLYAVNSGAGFDLS